MSRQISGVPAQITLPIVGTEYPNKRPKDPPRRFALGLCERGDTVELRPEPNNEHDEHAIAVHNEQGMMMGYIPAHRAPFVGMQIRRGGKVSAKLQGRTERGGWVRIAFDGETPVLPPERADQSPTQDWWPDEVFPDD